MSSKQGHSRLGRWSALVLALALAAAACGNSGDDEAASEEPSAASEPSTEGGGGGGVERPGVTDDEIRFSAVGTRSNNPLGTCVLDCYVDGIEAYFAYRNSEGGVHGRDMVLSNVVDDELAQNQARSLEIVTADDTFAAFGAPTIADGFEVFAEARMPLYVWTIQVTEMTGRDSIFGNREVSCIACVRRATAYVAELAEAERVASLGYGVSEASRQCANADAESIEAYGGDVGAESVYVNDDLAFGLPNGIGPEVTAMREADVDLITACIDLNGMQTLAQELERQGMQDVTLFHTNTYNQSFVEENAELFEGDYVQAIFRPFEADSEGSALAAYREWMEEMGSELTEPAMVGWINADLAYRGILEAGEDFDRESVIAATNEMTEYTASGLTQPVDWSRQHEPRTDEDPATHGPEHDCIALVEVADGGQFEVVGDAAAPWHCWPGDTLDWSEPEPMNFE